MLISQVPVSRKNLKFYLNVNFYLIVCLNGSKVNLEIFQLKLEGDLLMLNQFHLRYHAVRLAHTTAMMAQHHFRIPEMCRHTEISSQGGGEPDTEISTQYPEKSTQHQENSSYSTLWGLISTITCSHVCLIV